MSVFNAHIPRGRFSPEQKRTLADALNQSLVQGGGLPKNDRFIILNEYGPDDLFLYPTLQDMNRDFTNVVIITAPVGSLRTSEDKHKLVAIINRLVVSAVGISSDDIFITLAPVSDDNEPNLARIWPWD